MLWELHGGGSTAAEQSLPDPLPFPDVRELIRRFKTFVPCGDYGAAVGLPGFWCRVSAYVYNDLKDFEMLGRAVADIVGVQP